MEQPGSQTIALFGIIVQFILAVVGVWYAWETRRLRQSGETQIALLREQGQSSLKPYIFPTIRLFDKEKRKIAIQEDKTISDIQKQDRISDLEEDDTQFLCLLENASNKISIDISVLIYDARTRSFLNARGTIAILPEKAEQSLKITLPYKSAEEAWVRIIERYGIVAQSVADALEIETRSYALVIFRDIEGRVYSMRRKFSIRDGRVNHLISAP